MSTGYMSVALVLLDTRGAASSLPCPCSLVSLKASSPAYTAASLFPSDSPVKTGPIISDVTDLAQSSPAEVASEWTDDRQVLLTNIVDPQQLIQGQLTRPQHQP